MKTNKRQVAPQWRATDADGKAVGGNLGKWNVETREFEKDDLAAMLELYPEAVCDAFNAQMHILLSGPQCTEMVAKEVPEQGKEEKYATWVQRTHEKAQEVAKTLMPLAVVNFAVEFEHWAKNRKIDPVIKSIREKWSASPNKQGFLDYHKITTVTVNSTAEEVEAAYRQTKTVKMDL